MENGVGKKHVNLLLYYKLNGTVIIPTPSLLATKQRCHRSFGKSQNFWGVKHMWILTLSYASIVISIYLNITIF